MSRLRCWTSWPANRMRHHRSVRKGHAPHVVAGLTGPRLRAGTDVGAEFPLHVLVLAHALLVHVPQPLGARGDAGHAAHLGAPPALVPVKAVVVDPEEEDAAVRALEVPADAVVAEELHHAAHLRDEEEVGARLLAVRHEFRGEALDGGLAPPLLVQEPLRLVRNEDLVGLAALQAFRPLAQVGMPGAPCRSRGCTASRR